MTNIELIKTRVNEEDEVIVSARELYEFLEVSERFSKWFDRMSDYGFENGLDFTPYQLVHPQNNQLLTDYALKIDMAKEISMIQRSEKGREARLYFLSIEKLWNTPEKVMERALQFAKKKVEEQERIIFEQKPKVLFAESIMGSESSVLVGELAKIINQNGYLIGPKQLFKWLRDNQYVMKSGSSYNQPTQKSMRLGIMEITKKTINTGNNIVAVTTTKVTPKGQQYFINKFLGAVKGE